MKLVCGTCGKQEQCFPARSETRQLKNARHRMRANCYCKGDVPRLYHCDPRPVHDEWPSPEPKEAA